MTPHLSDRQAWALIPVSLLWKRALSPVLTGAKQGQLEECLTT